MAVDKRFNGGGHKGYSHLGIGGRDATILAFMREESIERIMTHNAALKKIDWLEVIDPIP